MNKRTVGLRSLELLYNSGSSSRVLNVLRTQRIAASENMELSPPLFQSPRLNKCIIVKHRLRIEDAEYFSNDAVSVTKLILPFDDKMLAIGGKSVLIGQNQWLESLADSAIIDPSNNSADLAVLRCLDQLPSFDPFLLRESLTRAGFTPDSRYFSLTRAEIQQMEAFVLKEISALVTMSLMGERTVQHSSMMRLVSKMLSANYDNDLEPLRATLRLTKDEFREAMFCWIGFLYYKQKASALDRQIKEFIHEIRSFMAEGMADPELRRYYSKTAQAILRRMLELFNVASGMINDYDQSYHAMTSTQNPNSFRAFLMAAPKMFISLGDALGQLTHIVEFWAYRKSLTKENRIPRADFYSVIHGFADSLAVQLH